MASWNVIFWDVDTQVDFMLPGGKLYVPGAEKIIPNLRRLVDAAREGRVLLVSSADAHTPDDEEFQEWPPHCLLGTPGQKKIPETLTEDPHIIPNRPVGPLPADLRGRAQMILEKAKLDVFSNPNAAALVEQLAPREGPAIEFAVFGVVTEYCVRLAAGGLLERGRRVAIVTDAVETLDPAAGRRTLQALAARGARLVTTDQALAFARCPSAARR
jgi:nicotinamidase/pyrazinamidase